MEPIRFNTMDSGEFTARMAEVLQGVSGIIGKTLGPYGHNIIIPYGETTAVTKDGWNCLQQLTLKNPIDRYIKGMIEKCGQSVILKVGDGSTTVTVAANAMVQRLIQTGITLDYNIREIEDALKRCTDNIINELQQMSTPVTQENMKDLIKRVALVSTNWDEELSEMINDIYVNTNNPIIKVQDSGTDRTYVEYIHGYDIAGSLCLENYYLTNRIDGICEVENPVIIGLNFAVPQKMALSLITLGEVVASMGRQLVIMAPDFDQTLLQTIATQNRMRANKGIAYVNMIPVRFVNKFIIDRECVDDFCVMTSSALINNADDDFIDFLDNVVKSSTTPPLPYQEDSTDEEKAAIDALNEERINMIDTIRAYINEIGGTCEKLTISNKHIIATGLIKCNDKLVEERKETISSEIDSKTREFDALTMLTEDIRMKRIRLGKLQKNMGVIRIGGYGDANLKARRDAVDDATRACESAYYNGVIFGSCTAVGSAILHIVKGKNTSGIDQVIYDSIFTAFMEVFYTMLHNKYNRNDGLIPTLISDPDEAGGIVRNMSHRLANCVVIYSQCANLNCAYNLKTDFFDTDNIVINPVRVDIEVLKGCMRLVTMCITSDQMIIPQHAMDALYDTQPKSLELPNDIQEVK